MLAWTCFVGLNMPRITLSYPHPLSQPGPWLVFILLFACAALFLCLVLTVHIPSWTPVPADFVLLEDDLSKQKPVAQ